MSFRHFWPVLGLAAALAWPAVSHAADPVLGTAKFAQNCTECHSVASTAIIDPARNSPALIRVASGSCTITVVFTPTVAGSRIGNLSITHSGLTTAVQIVLSGTGVAAAQPTISLDASSFDFGNQTVNTTSDPQTLTVSNTGTAA